MISCKGYVASNLSQFSDNQLSRKLRIAERNIKEWQKRAEAIKREIAKREPPQEEV